MNGGITVTGLTAQEGSGRRIRSLESAAQRRRPGNRRPGHQRPDLITGVERPSLDERRQSHALPSAWPPGGLPVNGLDRRHSRRAAAFGSIGRTARLGVERHRRRTQRSSSSLYVLVLSVILDFATRPFWFLSRLRCSSAATAWPTETMGHWFKDHAKAVLIGLLFAEIGAVFVYFALRRWPDGWWIVAGARVLDGDRSSSSTSRRSCSCRCSTRSSRWRRPLLRDRLTALASKAGTRIMGVYEWTLSDRTKKANAALAGMGQHAAYSSVGHPAGGVFG